MRMRGISGCEEPRLDDCSIGVSVATIVVIKDRLESGEMPVLVRLRQELAARAFDFRLIVTVDSNVTRAALREYLPWAVTIEQGDSGRTAVRLICHHLPDCALEDAGLVVVPDAPGFLPGLRAIIMARRRGVPVVVWDDRTTPEQIDERWSRRFQGWIVRQAQLCVTSSPGRAAQYLRAGATGEQVVLLETAHASTEQSVESRAACLARVLMPLTRLSGRAAGATHRPRSQSDVRPLICIVWRSFLPYHEARITYAQHYAALRGVRIVGLEATSSRVGYEFLGSRNGYSEGIVTCLPGESIEGAGAKRVLSAVLERLCELRPEVVFAPAVPFPEGMAAVRYRQLTGKRVFIMDDSWEATDPRGRLVRWVKRQIHKCVDGAFVPAPEYASYFEQFGFGHDRLLFGVDVVDNDFFARPRDWQLDSSSGGGAFLFVGRDLPRKGLGVLLAAYAKYRKEARSPWQLMVAGPISGHGGMPEGVVMLGPQSATELRKVYWSATVLVVPSEFEQWGLVINEAMAASLPVIASRMVGAARSLIVEGKTGWKFDPGDVDGLAQLLLNVSSLSLDELRAVGRQAAERVNEVCSLSTFADSLMKALAIPRRPEAGALSRALCKLWRGHVRRY